MRLILLNQFGLKSGAPTGRILGELVVELERLGHEVATITTGASYGKPRRGVGRLAQEMAAHMILLWRSFVCAKADAVISMTSPACLAATAGVAARLHGARHFHWIMDVYPDLGVRLGELREGEMADFFRWLMRRAYTRAAGVVTLDEDMRDYVREVYGVESTVIGPFAPEVSWPAVAQDRDGTGRWLYSGNFGRAHEIDVLLQIQKRLEEREVKAELILQGDGPRFVSSRKRAESLGLRRVEWREAVAQEKLGESLRGADVLVVTRKAEMKGLLLPSKLVLAELSGRSVLWIGDTDGKTARRLAGTGRHGVFGIEEAEAIAAWLQERFEREYVVPNVEPKSTRVAREKAAAQWEALLRK